MVSAAGASQELIQVSAGLGVDGGGTATVGRLIAAGAAEYADEVGLKFRLFSMAGSAEGLSAGPLEDFSGRRTALTAAVLRAQLGRSCAGLVFDFAGPARIQALLPRRFQAPYLVFLHGIEVWRTLAWTRARSLRNATVLVANSSHTVERAEAFLPDLGRSQVLHLALEEDRPLSGPTNESVLEKAGSGFLLLVGRMSAAEQYKGHDQLIAAMPEVLKRHPGATLVVVGDGDDRQRLQAAVQGKGLAESVFFTGFVAEATLRELYRRCAALVMPSRGEGFGLVYLEAMRAQRPCVAASRSAAEEVVVDGRTGLLVDPESPGEIAEALVKLLSSPEYARELGQLGFERWRDEFSLQKFKKGLRRHLDRLVSGGVESC